MEEQQLSHDHFILTLRRPLTGQTETSHGRCCLTPAQSQGRSIQPNVLAPTAANKRCLGKENRYGACIEWFIPPQGCPTLISHPKHLRFKVSLSQKTTLSFNCLQWILIFLDYLLTLWVRVKFCHLPPLATQFTDQLCGKQLTSFTFWGNLLLITLNGLQFSHWQEKLYDPHAFNSPIASCDFIDLSYIPHFCLSGWKFVIR